ncbi:hypothetical protein [Chengkuizengella axinellae]|uniref:DUF3992 domain-containing protein n=1 Tax=Chengkuizengella axinellae TaxID=3064388 RepID=A0ABT9J218_9BACL|nr:hypothetical protein [Chengkuizengella sp. 2205SS18-9]MDP5275656.1 hypothetical protein [Chengkuizengella sp. 2205SS18-9]
MGQFDKTICDCCVCPMQCVLEQLIGQFVGIITTREGNELTINNVDDFTVFATDGANQNYSIPICNVSAVFSIPISLQIELKPSRTNVKGECSCCEDPTNRLLNTLSRSQELEFTFLNGSTSGFIRDIGEGIVLVESGGFLEAISICYLNKINTPSPF